MLVEIIYLRLSLGGKKLKQTVIKSKRKQVGAGDKHLGNHLEN